MIVRSNRVSSFTLLIICQGSIVPAIAPKLCGFALVGVLASLVHHEQLFGEDVRRALDFDFTPFTALGVAVSLFLGFHNNASYSRWWEARTYWGQQVIGMRNLGRYMVGYSVSGAATTRESAIEPSLNTDTVPHTVRPVEGDDNKSNATAIGTVDMSHAFPAITNEKGVLYTVNQEKDEEMCSSVSGTMINNRTKDTIDGILPGLKELRGKTRSVENWNIDILRLAIAQTHALRAQLRPMCSMDGEITALHDRNMFLTDEETTALVTQNNPANAILLEASKILGASHAAALIDTYSMIHVHTLIDRLGGVQASCERIHNTSLPLAYSLLVHRACILYVILVPFAVANVMRWWTPLITVIIAYTFFGLDELARQIQSPFSDEPMCLALSALSRGIESDALAALGMETRPALRPQKSILM